MSSNNFRRNELQKNLVAVRARIADAERAANKLAGSVQLLTVTKFFPATDVEELIHLGENNFGESREPEASRKLAELQLTAQQRSSLTFHYIGQLQRKKIKTVVAWAEVIQSVDSLELAKSIAAAAQQAGRRPTILMQLSLDDNPARGGVAAVASSQLAEFLAEAPELNFGGVMTIVPLEGEKERWFARAAQLRGEIVAQHPEALEFSAGMSGDLEDAIAYGSTSVRVGTAILGSR